MSVRSLFPFAFLGFVLACAGVLAMGWPIWWLAPVDWLSRYQLFHVVAHFSIFAGIVILYGPQKKGAIRLWVFVGSGGVLLELVQIAADGFSLTRSRLLDSLFDMGVDCAGAGVCWLMLAQHRRRRMLSAANGKSAETMNTDPHAVWRRLGKWSRENLFILIEK